MPGGKKSHKLETSWKGFFFALRTRDAFFYCCLFNGGRSCTCSLWWLPHLQQTLLTPCCGSSPFCTLGGTLRSLLGTCVSSRRVCAECSSIRPPAFSATHNDIGFSYIRTLINVEVSRSSMRQYAMVAICLRFCPGVGARAVHRWRQWQTAVWLSQVCLLADASFSANPVVGMDIHAFITYTKSRRTNAQNTPHKVLGARILHRGDRKLG